MTSTMKSEPGLPATGVTAGGVPVSAAAASADGGAAPRVAALPAACAGAAGAAPATAVPAMDFRRSTLASMPRLHRARCDPAPPKSNAGILVESCCPTNPSVQGRTTASAHRVHQGTDAFDPHPHHVAGLQEFLARHADAGGSAGQDQVAGIERDPAGQMGDLLGKR